MTIADRNSAEQDLNHVIADRLIRVTVPVGVVACAVGLALPFALTPDELYRAVPPAMGVLGLLGLLGLSRLGYPRAAAGSLLLLATAAILVGMWTGGGIDAPIFVGFFAVICGAASLWGARYAMAYAAGAIFFSALVVLAIGQGWTTAPLRPGPLFILGITAVWLALAVAFSTVPATVMRRAHAKSERRRLELEEARRREAEQASMMRGILDQTHQLIGVLDLQGRVLVANRTSLDRVRLTEESVVGMFFWETPWWPQGEQERLREAIRRAPSGESARFQTFHDTSVGTRTVDVSVKPLRGPDGEVERVLVEGRDITDLVLAKTELTAQQRRYEAVFQHAHDAIFLMRGSRFLDCNPATLTIFGCERDDIVGTTPGQFSPEHQPDGRTSIEAATAFIDAALNTGPQRFDWLHKRLDGQVFEAEVSLNAVEIGGEPHVLAVVRDLGERRRLERRLRHAERLDSVGNLAGGVAHDFNNMLSGVMGATEMLRLDGDLTPEAEEWVDLIGDAVDRAADLTHKLLRFARRQEGELGPVSVHEAILGAVGLLARSVDKRVAIATELAASRDVVVGDAAGLQNAFLNLGINAAHAMPEGGELRFRTHITRLTRSQCDASAFDLQPGPYLRVEVSDTGTGIPAAHLDRMFEPFFTTKPPGQGTGLGLAAVWGTVRQHEASIHVHSELGQGTVFHFDIPLAGEGMEAAVTLDGEPVQGTGLVLVVDDEAMVRSIATAILEQLGYTVVTADDGEQALDVYQREQPDLVLLDMVMPVLSGRQTFERLRALDPGVHVLLSSGFSRDEDVRAMREQGLMGFVPKPYDVARLSRAVAMAMEDIRSDGRPPTS